MAAPTSAVDICNLALDQLKQETVTDIESPTTDTEVICARHYDKTRRALLRLHPWSFAKSRKALTRDATDPTFGYADAYNLPGNYLRLLFIGDDSIGNYIHLTKIYEIENGQILIGNSGSSTLNIGYMKDETQVTKFDALFITLFELQLAKNMAYAFTLKNSLVNRLVENLNDAKNEAKAINGQERPIRRVERSKFLRARQHLFTNVAGPNTIFGA